MYSAYYVCVCVCDTVYRFYKIFQAMSLKPKAVTILPLFGSRYRYRNLGRLQALHLRLVALNHAYQEHLLHVQDESAVLVPLVQFSAGGRSSPAEQTLTKSLR